eukprot:TRINITY_DN44933_c0_g1_i1.p1 TRINITY_DN44933_c0_g1~~TRINITY_DN44933_c0_g1_i1.p1  ORF type:complete len:276 (+),score=64.25 TRINITY_DN44933_c0_g1_i1:83-910(+)
MEAEGVRDGKWFLVWCHEGCHKEGAMEMGKMLKDVITEAGGVLIRLKKASKFLDWWTYNADRPLVLLTDWREAKPCVEGMHLSGRHVNANCPLGICIFTKMPQVFKRASAWAASAPIAITVLADPTSASMKMFLQTSCGISFLDLQAEDEMLAAQRQPKGLELVDAERRHGDEKLEKEARSLESIPHTVSLSTLLPLPRKGLELVDIKPPHGVSRFEETITSASEDGQKTAMPVLLQGSENQGILDLLHRLLQDPENAAELQKILLEAMPRVYED